MKYYYKGLSEYDNLTEYCSDVRAKGNSIRVDQCMVGSLYYAQHCIHYIKKGINKNGRWIECKIKNRREDKLKRILNV